MLEMDTRYLAPPPLPQHLPLNLLQVGPRFRNPNSLFNDCWNYDDDYIQALRPTNFTGRDGIKMTRGEEGGGVRYPDGTGVAMYRGDRDRNKLLLGSGGDLAPHHCSKWTPRETKSQKMMGIGATHREGVGT